MSFPASWLEHRAAATGLVLVLVVSVFEALGCSADTDADTDADSGDTAATATEPSSTAPTSTATESDALTTDDDGPLPPPDCVAPEVACGQSCADLAQDPSNCGMCGISCIIDNAEPTCVAGACGLAACDVGWADCDGTLGTGCEIAIECVDGGGCMTACGSTGTTSCGDPCAPACTAPAETCNALDDDCDGTCDQGPLPGCRVGVHRAVGGALGHFYTTSVEEVGANGLAMEIQDFFFVYPQPLDGLIPLFRCIKPDASGRRFLTSSIDCEATAAPELTLGFISPDADCGAIPLYRLYAPASDDHFYTTSAAERDNAIAMFGYQDQGSPGFVFAGL